MPLFGATVVGGAVVVEGGAIVVAATRGGSTLTPVVMSTAHVLFTQSRTLNED